MVSCESFACRAAVRKSASPSGTSLSTRGKVSLRATPANVFPIQLACQSPITFPQRYSHLWTTPKVFAILRGMARHPKNQEAAAELGEHLTQLYEAAGEPTPTDIALWLYKRYDTKVSAETIRKAHRGEVDPTTCRHDLLAGLAAFYGVEVTQLGPMAARQFLTLAAMTSGSPGIHAMQLELTFAA